MFDDPAARDELIRHAKRVEVIGLINETLWDGRSDDPEATVVVGRDRVCAKRLATPDQLAQHNRRADEWRAENADSLRDYYARRVV